MINCILFLVHGLLKTDSVSELTSVNHSVIDDRNKAVFVVDQAQMHFALSAEKNSFSITHC